MKKGENKKGSALITVLVILTVLGTGLAAVLGHSVHERKLNTSQELWLKAQNVAESASQYGLAQLRLKFANRSNINQNALQPGSADELVLPSGAELANLMNDGGYNVIQNVEIVGGVVPTSWSWVYFDPANREYQDDDLVGESAWVKEVDIFSRATVQRIDRNTSNAIGNPVSAHTVQTLQIRNEGIFSHAIFYNLDLDIHPGPQMDIYGKVHTNGLLRLNAYTGLNFHGKVTTAKHLLHAYEHQASKYFEPVQFKDEDGNLQNMKHDNIWKDSTMGTGSLSPDFREWARERWGDMVKTSDHDVNYQKPVAFDEYLPDDLSTPEYDPINSGRAIIEPPLASGHPDYDAELEEQKLSAKAGLYFTWDTYTGELTAKKRLTDGTYSTITNLGDLVASDDTDKTGLYYIEKNADGDPVREFYEDRRNEDIYVMNFNMGALKQLIENPDTTDIDKHLQGFDPATDWNGIVYVESKSSNPDSNAAEKLDYSGVRLRYAQVGVSEEGIPSRGHDPGMTFVTNNVMYVQGHFNSDGSMSVSSSQTPEVNEVPVALMADAVTFLSESWDDDHPDMGDKPDASSTEVSAAVVSGIRPPNVQGDDTRSGGAHNFPRFLESWSGDTFYLRGSMVCLYECEIDRSEWNTSYYSPPNRAWGYNTLFDTYDVPGEPRIRTYKRINHRSLSEAEYLAQKPW